MECGKWSPCFIFWCLFPWPWNWLSHDESFNKGRKLGWFRGNSFCSLRTRWADLPSSPWVCQFYDYIIWVTGGRREEAARLGSACLMRSRQDQGSVEKGWDSIPCGPAPCHWDTSIHHGRWRCQCFHSLCAKERSAVKAGGPCLCNSADEDSPGISAWSRNEEGEGGERERLRFNIACLERNQGGQKLKIVKAILQLSRPPRF